MDAIDRFAAEAEAYERWAGAGEDTGEAAAREGLTRIVALYRAALELPTVESDSTAGEDGPGDDAWRAVFDGAVRRLPFDDYGLVFDPEPMPPEEPVEGSLADDVADIWRDVVTGLRAYRSGQRAEAAWHWRSHLWAHWGAHATGAIRALHSWLASRRGP